MLIHTSYVFYLTTYVINEASFRVSIPRNFILFYCFLTYYNFSFTVHLIFCILAFDVVFPLFALFNAILGTQNSVTRLQFQFEYG